MLASIAGRFVQAALVLSSLYSAAAASATLRRATTCNGHSELCSKSYGTVSFVGAHNSYAVGTNNLAVNQDQDVTQQLNDGVRLLQMQAHNESGTIQLCHSSCFLYNGGTLQDYLKKVVTLLIVNIDNMKAAAYDPIFVAAGLDKLSFAPATSPLAASAWPTLGELIDKGTRLVTFLDNAADLTSVPYLIDEFTNIWETPFDVTEPSFPCDVNRTQGETSTQMYLINHFLDKIVLNNPAPNVAAANITNAVDGVGALGVEVATCTARHGRAPNFLLVDFYEYGGGSVFQVAATINGVIYNPTSPIATPITGSAPPNNTQTGSATRAIALLSQSQVVAFLVVASSMLFGARRIV
ncbi:PLC-like phosphodiesterase [Mycena rebaudengoi]|nr:PLC-like phosphodiesterase [Mycena rebaudengoi]